jgi:hypothetical protein
MKSILLIIGLTLISLAANAQEFPSDLWHDGKLVLVSEDTLVGKVKYNQAQGIVQVEIGEKTYTHSASSIFYFEIYDITVESYRQFYVLPYGLVTSYKTPAVFEVLVEGNLTLLSREAIVTKNIQNPYSYGNYAKETLVYDYFFLDRKGTITKYTLKKKDLFTAVAKRQSQVVDYMKANRMHHDRRNDLVRIIAFYNALL